MGTLLRSGDQLRAATQLVEAPEGTLLTSHTVQSPLGDLFRMQDDIARRVVEGLALPLTGERPSSSPDVPDNPRAYELYLRANGLARTYDGMPSARALYEQCLELDPDFAPAWAHLGRCLRVIGKYIDPTPDSDRSRRGRIRPRDRLEPTTLAGAQVLCESRGRYGPGPRRYGQAPERSHAPRQRSPSCSRDSSTRAATRACSRSRSPLTPKPGDSTRRSRPASCRPC